MQEILYIHGFLSSPQSAKAQVMLAWARQHPEWRVHVPALPVEPAAALRQLEAIVASCESPPSLIGSSLGGFYANILAARHGLRAVLLNPAVHPHLLLRAYAGTQKHHHTGEAIEVRPEHFALLEQLEQKPPHPERIRVLLETGDETLDYRMAVAFYAGCEQEITEGGSHAYEGFADRLPAIVAFLNEDTRLKK